MKILFITLSNIGDSILTLPVLDALKEKYPGAKITCLVPERPKELFSHDPSIDKVLIFDKHARLKEKIKLFLSLAKERFDIVIDMRNSFFGAFLPAKKRSSPLRKIPKEIKHMKDRHLFWAKLSGIGSEKSLKINAQDSEFIEKILKENKAEDLSKLIVIAPGARSQVKCWDKKKFVHLCKSLLDKNYRVVLAGDKQDQPVCSFIKNSCPQAIDLCAKTTLFQLAALLKKSRLLVTNDSAVMHLASYLNVAVVAIFGPTDEEKYGPWSTIKKIIKKDIHCRPCQKAQCCLGTLSCLGSIKPDEVFAGIEAVLCADSRETAKAVYKRILISRTDRIGDVILSTPVIKAIRKKFPQAYISMMVGPHALDIVEANPYLDEVIIYDKARKHRSWAGSLKFASRLKKKKFDLAIILHPNNRVHLISFLAGIPKRIGYNRNFGFLLNLKQEHEKQEGSKHEAEYNFDLLSGLGVSVEYKDLFMPIKQESQDYIDELLEKEGISKKDKLLAINPGASCSSKIWPPENFAKAAEKLANLYNFKIMIIGGPKEILLANKVAGLIKADVVNLAGKTSVSQLASALKRCTLFISNDSGPVHIASALGIAVISIFGRKQKGLSPKRWRPLGKNDKYLHKDCGCIQCLAHNCKKEFACLKAVTVEEVISAAESVLKSFD